MPIKNKTLQAFNKLFKNAFHRKINIRNGQKLKPKKCDRTEKDKKEQKNVRLTDFNSFGILDCLSFLKQTFNKTDIFKILWNTLFKTTNE